VGFWELNDEPLCSITIVNFSGTWGNCLGRTLQHKDSQNIRKQTSNWYQFNNKLWRATWGIRSRFERPASIQTHCLITILRIDRSSPRSGGSESQLFQIDVSRLKQERSLRHDVMRYLWRHRDSARHLVYNKSARLRAGIIHIIFISSATKNNYVLKTDALYDSEGLTLQTNNFTRKSSICVYNKFLHTLRMSS
jgi:hypothetical protein